MGASGGAGSSSEQKPKTAAEQAKATRALVNEIGAHLGSIPKASAWPQEITFGADSPFAKELKDLRTRLEQKDWTPASLKAPALEFFDKRLQKTFEDLHASILEGDSFDPLIWKNKINAMIETELRAYLESKTEAVGTPAKKLWDSQKALYEALKSVAETKMPDENEFTRGLQLAEAKRGALKSSHAGASERREKAVKLKEAMDKALDQAKQLAQKEDDDLKALAEVKHLAGTNPEKAQALQHRVLQYKRGPEYQTELAEKIERAKTEEQDELTKLLALKPGGAGGFADATEAKAQATHLAAELKTAQEKMQEMDKGIAKTRTELVKLTADYDQRVAAAEVKGLAADKLVALRAKRDAVEAVKEAKQAELTRLETARTAHERDNVTTVQTQLNVLKPAIARHQTASDNRDSLEKESKAIEGVVQLQTELQAFVPPEEERPDPAKPTLPEALRPAFETMQEVSRKLREVKESPDLATVTVRNAKGKPELDDYGDPVQQLTHPEDAKKFAKEAVVKVAEKVLHQELARDHVDLARDATLDQQITAATGKLMEKLRDIPELKEDLDKIAAKPAAEQGEKLVELFQERPGLRERDELNRLAEHLKLAMDISEESKSDEPSRAALVGQLEDLRDLSQQQLERQEQWYLHEEDKKAAASLATGKGEQEAVLAAHQSLQTGLRQKADEEIRRLEAIPSTAGTTAEHEARRAKIAELKSLRDQAVTESDSLASASRSSQALLTEMREKSEAMLGDKLAGEHFAFINERMKRQGDFVKTAAIRKQRGWKDKDQVYSCIPKGVTDLSTGREMHDVVGGGKGVTYQPGMIYQREGSRTRIFFDMEGKGDDAVAYTRMVATDTWRSPFSAATSSYNVFLNYDKSKAARNLNLQYDFMEAAGVKKISIIPPEKFLKHYLSADSEDLFKRIDTTMEVLANRQLNAFKVSKLPSEDELRKNFKNTYLIVETAKKKYELHYVDEKGNSHKSGLPSEMIQRKFSDAGILKGTFRTKLFGTMVTRGVAERMSHLTSPAGVKIKGGKVEKLSFGVEHLAGMKGLIDMDPSMPREKGSGNMIWQSTLGLGSQKDVNKMSAQITQMVARGQLSPENADKLQSKLSLFSRTVGVSKQMVQSAEEKRQQPADRAEAMGAHELESKRPEIDPAVMASHAMADPHDPVPGRLSGVHDDQDEEEEDEEQEEEVVEEEEKKRDEEKKEEPVEEEKEEEEEEEKEKEKEEEEEEEEWFPGKLWSDFAEEKGHHNIFTRLEKPDLSEVDLQTIFKDGAKALKSAEAMILRNRDRGLEDEAKFENVVKWQSEVVERATKLVTQLNDRKDELPGDSAAKSESMASIVKQAEKLERAIEASRHVDRIASLDEFGKAIREAQPTSVSVMAPHR